MMRRIDDIIIRRAGAPDMDAVSRVIASAFDDKIVAIGGQKRAGRVVPIIVGSMRGEKFIAVTGGEVVGAIIVTTEEIDPVDGNVLKVVKVLGLFGALKAWRVARSYTRSTPKRLEKEGVLEAVGVMEDHRGQGVGGLLVRRAEARLKNLGMKTFGLGVKENSEAVRFYERLGFEVVTKYHNRLGDWLYMRKRI